MENYLLYLEYVQYIVYLLIPGLVMYIFYIRNQVKMSVGWNFVKSMSKVKMSANDLVLRIKSPSGKEYYQASKINSIIEYDYYTDTNKKIKKMVLYDPKTVDYLNGIPILNVTPSDIRPIDRDLGTLINIPTEVIKKLITDSTKDPKHDADKAKYDKVLIYSLIGVCILFILGLSYLNQTNAELQNELMRLTIEMGKSATISPNN